jgi:hypothetical protein
MMVRFRIPKFNARSMDSLWWVLIPCLLIFGLFAFLGYCSFPVSDDFIMAQDAQKGFFWAILYWMGFWFSGWFVLVLQLSIPPVFGFLDYGLFPIYLSLVVWCQVSAVEECIFRFQTGSNGSRGFCFLLPDFQYFAR